MTNDLHPQGTTHKVMKVLDSSLNRGNDSRGGDCTVYGKRPISPRPKSKSAYEQYPAIGPPFLMIKLGRSKDVNPSLGIRCMARQSLYSVMGVLLLLNHTSTCQECLWGLRCRATFGSQHQFQHPSSYSNKAYPCQE